MSMVPGNLAIVNNQVVDTTGHPNSAAMQMYNIIFPALQSNLPPSMNTVTATPPSIAFDPSTGLPFKITTNPTTGQPQVTSLVTPGSAQNGTASPASDPNTVSGNMKLAVAIANTLAGFTQYIQTNAQTSATSPAYIELYTAAVGAGQTLTNANQFYQLTQFDSIGDGNNKIIASLANDNIVIITPGTYLVTADLTLTSNASNVNYTVTSYVNGIENTTVVARTKVGSAGDIKSIAFTDVRKYNAGDTIDVRISCDTAGKIVTLESGNFNVMSVSGPNGVIL